MPFEHSQFSRLLRSSSLACAALCLAVPQAGALEKDEPGIPSEREAPIALLVDLSSGQTLFAREAERRFVPASITKAMTTFLAFEKMERGELFAQQVFTVSDRAFRAWRRRGSTMFLNRGDRVSVHELLSGVTTVSANDASVVLAEGASGSLDAWLGEMNKAAQSIGMNNSHFGSPNGYPDEGQTWTTARDLVTLGKAMLRRHPDKYRSYVGHSEFTYGGITQPNHDPLLGKVRGADGIKTGFTYQAGFGFLGTAQRNGHRLLMVVAGSDSGRERNRAAVDLMEWGFTSFDRQVLFRDDEIVASAMVQDGDAISVDLLPPHAVAVASPKGTRQSVTLAVEYSGPLRAPIAAGEEVARLRITHADGEVSLVPLHAANAVERAGFFGRMVNGVVGWFR